MLLYQSDCRFQVARSVKEPDKFTVPQSPQSRMAARKRRPQSLNFFNQSPVHHVANPLVDASVQGFTPQIKPQDQTIPALKGRSVESVKFRRANTVVPKNLKPPQYPPNIIRTDFFSVIRIDLYQLGPESSHPSLLTLPTHMLPDQTLVCPFILWEKTLHQGPQIKWRPSTHDGQAPSFPNIQSSLVGQAQKVSGVELNRFIQNVQEVVGNPLPLLLADLVGTDVKTTVNLC